MNNDPNKPGNAPEQPSGETPAVPGETPSSGQPTERVIPPSFQPPPAPDPSQYTMPMPQTTIYSPQPPPASGPGSAPPPYTQPMGAAPASQQPHGGEQARAPQQPYPQGQYPPPGQYPQQGYPPPGQNPQGQYTQGQYPPQYQQGQYPPPGPPTYPQPGYAQPAQPLPKKGGVPVIVWVLGGSLVAILLICGTLAFIVSAALNTASRSITTAFSTVEANVGGIPSWLFYNDLNSGNYEDARQYLSADLKSQYTAAKLKADWERLTKATGGITVGDYTLDSATNTSLWRQELEGQDNNKLYEIQITVKTVGSDYVITDAKPALIPSP